MSLERLKSTFLLRFKRLLFHPRFTFLTSYSETNDSTIASLRQLWHSYCCVLQFHHRRQRPGLQAVSRGDGTRPLSILIGTNQRRCNPAMIQ